MTDEDKTSLDPDWPGDAPLQRKLSDAEDAREYVDAQIAKEPEWVQKLIKLITHLAAIIIMASVLIFCVVGTFSVSARLLRWGLG